LNYKTFSFELIRLYYIVREVSLFWPTRCQNDVSYHSYLFFTLQCFIIVPAVEAQWPLSQTRCNTMTQFCALLKTAVLQNLWNIAMPPPWQCRLYGLLHAHTCKLTRLLTL